MFPNVRRAISLIERETYPKWVLVAGGTVFVATLEASGALLVAMIAGLIVSRGETNVSELEAFGSLVPTLSSDTAIWVFALVVGGFFALRAGAIVLQSYAQARLAHNTGVRLAGRLLRQYLQAPYSFHLSHNSAELVRNNLQTIVDLSGAAFQPMIVIFGDLTLIAVLMALLVYVSDLQVLVIAGILSVLLFFILRRVQPRLEATGELGQESHRYSLQFLQQAFDGVREIKLLGKHHYFERQFVGPRIDLARSYYARAGLIEIPRTVLETAVVLFVLTIVALTLTRGESSQDLLVTLGLLAYAGFRVLPALNRVVSSLNTFRVGVPAVKIISEELAKTSDIIQAEGPGTLAFTTDVRLVDVDFSYEGERHPVLSSVNLQISKGQATGVVGLTGSGKSTLLDVMTGLLPPSNGDVLVDGQSIRSDMRGWQRQIGFVPQHVFLLDDTLRRNIAIGIPDDEIDDQQVARAISVAQLETFVRNLPQGLETVVGERGARISGGERQRIAIARALYARPSLLILDEGTSALDAETEGTLVEALSSDHTLTLLMVAHRVTSLRFCDRIVLLEGGTITRVMTYEELVSQGAMDGVKTEES